jgi:hypothetical protein
MTWSKSFEILVGSQGEGVAPISLWSEPPQPYANQGLTSQVYANLDDLGYTPRKSTPIWDDPGRGRGPALLKAELGPQSVTAASALSAVRAGGKALLTKRSCSYTPHLLF